MKNPCLADYNLGVSYYTRDTRGRKFFACIYPLEGGGAIQYYKTKGQYKDGLRRIWEKNR